MTSNIELWLEGLGLAKYGDVFVENEVRLNDLPHFTEDDLKELGLPLGPRKRVLSAIQSISGDAAAEPDTSEETTVAHAERRQLTVMFVDLVGSTELSQSLDPEDLQEVMRHYQDAIVGTVTRYEGHVAKYLSDGVLAYFN